MYTINIYNIIPYRTVYSYINISTLLFPFLFFFGSEILSLYINININILCYATTHHPPSSPAPRRVLLFFFFFFFRFFFLYLLNPHRASGKSVLRAL